MSNEQNSEELADYVADINNQTDYLKLLISSVENDLTNLIETREVAERAADWLLTLRERLSEIEADIPAGAPDNVVRTVTENSRTLRFTQQGFERD